MRIERCFAFVDLCGFTRLTDTLGDEAAVAVLTGFRGTVREVASEHGVRVAKWLGDGAMFVATDGTRLVAAMLELTERVDQADVALPLRGGLDCGAVILFEGDDYIGGPVNVAARLCDAAGPGEFLVSEDIVAKVEGEFDAIPVGPTAVRGLVQPIEVWRFTTASDDELPVGLVE